MSAANPPQEGRFVWYELVTKDKSKAQEFYTSLLGWKVQEEDMGEYGKYPMVGVGETWLGGMVSPQDEKIPLEDLRPLRGSFLPWSRKEGVSPLCHGGKSS